MSRRPIDPGIRARGPSEDDLVEAFREAMARWVSGVTLVAVRDPDDGKVYATTVGSLSSVTADPPRVVFSLGAGAQALPFLKEGRRFAVNGLGAAQKALAVRYTDSFPVGSSPFGDAGDPVVEGSHFVLRCTVERLIPVDASRLVLGRVEGAHVGQDVDPLVYHLRDYRSLK